MSRTTKERDAPVRASPARRRSVAASHRSALTLSCDRPPLSADPCRTIHGCLVNEGDAVQVGASCGTDADGERRGEDPYEADGAVSAERFIAALTDFSERRPELWPNLDAKYYELHELGDTWADVTEGTDSSAGLGARALRLVGTRPRPARLIEAIDFSPGTVIDYHVTSRPDGGCHVAWTSSASPSVRGAGSSACSCS